MRCSEALARGQAIALSWQSTPPAGRVAELLSLGLIRMRSVFVHLAGVTRDAVCARLSDFAERTGDEWRFPRGSKSHSLEIGFYHDLELESEPEDLETLKAGLGQLPDLIVYANISGRIPGDAEALQFVTFLLRHFRGVAWDDYTPHCWTLAEIETGVQVDGHPFFDYDGWYKEKHKA